MVAGGGLDCNNLNSGLSEYMDQTFLSWKINNTLINLNSIENSVVKEGDGYEVFYQKNYFKQYQLIIRRIEVFKEDQLFPFLFEDKFEVNYQYEFKELDIVEFNDTNVPGLITLDLVVDKYVDQ